MAAGLGGRAARRGHPRGAGGAARPRPLALLLRELLDDVGGDVGDLLLRERVLEGGHAAAAVRHLCAHLLRVECGLVADEVRTPVRTRSVHAVTAGAVVAPDGCTRLDLALYFVCRLVRVLPGVSRPLALLAGGSDFGHGALEREEPEVVAVSRGGERVAAREEGEVLGAVVLEHRRCRVRARARLEAPERPLAGLGVVGLQLAVVAPDEDEIAAGRDRPGVARLRPALLPLDLAGARLDRKKVALLAAEARRREDAPEVGHLTALARGQLFVLRRVAGDAAHRADVEHARFWVVARRLPVGPALRAGDDGRDRLAERREDAALDDLRLRPVLGVRARELLDRRDVVVGDLMGEEGRVAGDRLRLRCRLARELRHRLLLDRQQRLARLPVEEVEPAGLRCLGNPLVLLAVDLDVEEDDRAGRVVVPDVVVHLLEVPAVLTGLRVDRDNRGGEEVVAPPPAAVQVGGGVAGGEVEEPQLGVDRRCKEERSTAVLPRVVLLRPGVVPLLAWAGDGVEAPDFLAGLGVVRLYAPTDREFATGDARDHHAVVVERCGGDRVALLPVSDGDLPD